MTQLNSEEVLKILDEHKKFFETGKQKRRFPDSAVAAYSGKQLQSMKNSSSSHVRGPPQIPV